MSQTLELTADDLAEAEGFDIREEIQRLRDIMEQRNQAVQTAKGKGGGDSSLDAMAAQPPSAAVPSHVKRRSEALEKGMSVAYHNFTAVRNQSGAVIRAASKREVKGIDVSHLLPKGYDPKTDPDALGTPRPPKSSSGRRSGARPGKKGASSAGSREERGKSAAPRPPGGRKSGVFPRGGAQGGAPEAALKAAEVENKEEEVAPPARNHEAEEEERAAAFKLLSAEQQAQQLAADRRQRWRQYLSLVSAAAYVAKLQARYLQLREHVMPAVRRLQHFARVHVKAFLFRKFWGEVQWPMRCRIKMRVFRKQQATACIAHFLKEHLVKSPQYHMKMFMGRVRQCNVLIKGFLSVCSARKELMQRYWIKTETAIRKRIAIREKKLLIKLKQEQKERMLAGAKVGGAGKSAGSIHAKWLAKQAEIAAILARSEVVQSQARSSIAPTLRVLHEEPQPGEGEEASVSTVSQPAKERDEVNYDVLDEHVRDRIISATISDKRRQHIGNVVRDGLERARTRGMVDEADVHAFVKARGAAHRGSLVVLNNKMTDGLFRLNQRSGDRDLPRLRGGFLMLTDPEIGASWYKVVHDAVMADVR